MLLLSATACSEYDLAGRAEAQLPGEVVETCPDSDDPAAGYAVDVDPECQFAPDPGSFTPVVEWQWSSDGGAPGYDDVMMMPAVGDLDGDGFPEVVVTAYAANSYGGSGALVILDGRSGREIAAYTSIGGYGPNASAGVALGDLHGDGRPEIVTITPDARVLVLHADGSLLWASEPRPADLSPYGYPVIADLDGDGRAEIVAGRAIFDTKANLVGVGAYGMGSGYAIPVVADLDLDGAQEVIVGNAAYSRDGSAKWVAPTPDGWPAVADFDGDGLGEVVVVAGGVYLLDTDGTLLWGPVGIPGGGGGPPTVADFDGDGAVEIGVAGAAAYSVFDTAGSVLWSMPTQDASSAQTGSAVFDFEGDGAAEVVYGDELTLWVYDGATGAVELQEESHSSWTLFEYPVIVDVDGDGQTEIVLASNDSINPGWQGVTVIGDASGSWAPSALAWNQHSYSITNVEDDLSIPAHPAMNWTTGRNSFRTGGARDRLGNSAPDLVPAGVVLCACEGAQSVARVRVENRGGRDVAEELTVALYSNRQLLTLAALPGGLRAGEGSPELEVPIDPALLGDRLRVVADDDGTGVGVVTECDEANNVVEVIVEGCD
jgi:hypothetical protein